MARMLLFEVRYPNDFHRERKDIRCGTAAGSVLANLSARVGLVWSEKGVRRRRLRRLHGLARRQANPQLPFSCPEDWWSFGDNHRGSGAKRTIAPDASAVSRSARISVRLLYRRHDHDRRQPV